MLRHAFDKKVTIGSEQMSQQTTVEAEEGEVDVEVDFDFKVERTGKTKKIEGNKASEVYSTVKVDFKGEGAADGGKGPRRGRRQQAMGKSSSLRGAIVVDSRLWMSKKVKGYEEVKDFHLRLAKAYAGELGFTQDHAETMKEALMSRSPHWEGLEKAAEEARKLEGVELANTTWVVVVPGGMEYQSDLVRGKKKKKKGGGFGGFAKGLAKKAAASKMGLEGEDEGEAEEKPPEQATIITMKKKMGEFKTKTLKDKLFQIPAGYDEVKQPVIEYESEHEE